MSVMKSKINLIFPGQVLKKQPSDVSPCLRLSSGNVQPQLTMELQKEWQSQHRHRPGYALFAHRSLGNKIPIYMYTCIYIYKYTLHICKYAYIYIYIYMSYVLSVLRNIPSSERGQIGTRSERTQLWRVSGHVSDEISLNFTGQVSKGFFLFVRS